jgi:hypothetical protein
MIRQITIIIVLALALFSGAMLATAPGRAGEAEHRCLRDAGERPRGRAGGQAAHRSTGLSRQILSTTSIMLIPVGKRPCVRPKFLRPASPPLAYPTPDAA